MKKVILSFSLMLFSAMGIAQNVNIPDANFKKELVGTFGCDYNGDGEIQYDEAKTLKLLLLDSKGISDLTGIEAFTNLEIYHAQ